MRYHYVYKVEFNECSACEPRDIGDIYPEFWRPGCYFHVKQAAGRYDETVHIGHKVGDIAYYVCKHGQRCFARIVGRAKWSGDYSCRNIETARTSLGCPPEKT